MIRQLRQQATFGFSLVRDGRIGPLVGALGTAIWSTTHSYGLRRDLSRPFPAPEAAMAITVRSATDQDTEALFDLSAPDIPETERADRRDRATLLRNGLRTAYVATDAADTPCYFQGLLFATDNAFIARSWKNSFPPLESHQILLEGAFTPQAFRGRRIMPAAMARIVEAAASDTIREAIAYVTRENTASLKGCVRSGFEPFCSRTVTRRWFRQTTVISPLPDSADTLIPGVDPQ